VRVYEEYASARDKRVAQRGARRGVATGKAKGYVLVFDENGHGLSRGEAVWWDALGELFTPEHDSDNPPRCITDCTPAWNYLREKCRRVGFESIPVAWKRAFALRLDYQLTVPQHDADDNYKQIVCAQRRRYRNILKWAKERA
jgi:hypothetical protein